MRRVLRYALSVPAAFVVAVGPIAGSAPATNFDAMAHESICTSSVDQLVAATQNPNLSTASPSITLSLYAMRADEVCPGARSQLEKAAQHLGVILLDVPAPSPSPSGPSGGG